MAKPWAFQTTSKSRKAAGHFFYIFPLILLILTLAVCLQPDEILKPLLGQEEDVSLQSTEPKDIFALTQLIARQYPELTDNRIDDWQKVNILRQWAYQHIDRASEFCLLDTKESFKFYTKDAPELFEAFFQDKGGVWCRGTSYALMKLYQLYGFDSYIVGMGKRGAVTHVVTLVKVSYTGRDILTVQDAYFNVTYVDSAGTPYDYFELIKVLRNHEHDKVKIVTGSEGIEAEVIFCPAEIPHPATRVMSDARTYEQLACEHISEGRIKCKVRPSLENFVRYYQGVPLFQEFLIQKGHPPDLIYLFLYPSSVFKWGWFISQEN